MRRALVLFSLAICACPLPEYHYPPGPPDIKSFAATPFEVPPGGSSELSWRVDDATRVTLAGEVVDSAGTKQLSFNEDTTIELIAESPGGMSRAQITIKIQNPSPATIEEFSVAPPEATPHEAVTIRWRTANATRVSLSLTTGEQLLSDAPKSGSYVHRSDVSFGVELRVEGFEGPKIQTLTVDINERGPLIEKFYVDPPIVTPPATAELILRVFRAHEMIITELFDTGAEVLIYQGPASTGEWQFTLQPTGGSRTVRLVANSPGGTVTETTRMIVLPQRSPEIVELSVSPDINGPGGTSLVRWVTRYADEVEIVIDSRLSQLGVEGSLWWDFEQSGDIELTAMTSATGEVVTRSVLLTIDPARPRIHLNATPEVVNVGDEATITWETERADNIRFLTDAGELIATSTQTSGQFSYVATAPVYLVAIATNSFGETSNVAELWISEWPEVQLFISSDTPRAGRPVQISWVTNNAIRGTLSGPKLLTEIYSDIRFGSRWVIFPPVASGEVRFEAHGTILPGATATASIDLSILPANVSTTEEEPNDIQATANGPYWFSFGSNLIQGTLETGGVDMYAISTSNGRIRAELFGLDNCAIPTAIDVYEEDPTRELFAYVTTFESPGCVVLDPGAQADIASLRGNMVLGLRPTIVGFLPQTYGLDVVIESPSCGDGIHDRYEDCDDGNSTIGDGCFSCLIEGLDEVEPNQDRLYPSEVELDVPQTAFLGHEDLDFFHFTLPPDRAGAVNISLSPHLEITCPKVVLTLYRDFLPPIVADPTPGCAELSGPETVLPAGDYYISVYADLGLSRDVRGTYTLLVDAP